MSQPFVPRQEFAPSTHPSLSDAKGFRNGSFTSVLLHASSSSLPSDSGESSQGAYRTQGTHQRTSFERTFGQPPAPQLRGSCRKCVECTRLSGYRVVDEAKSLWPGQLASPLAYLTIFRRRLEHQIASVPRNSRIWLQSNSHPAPRSRGQNSLAARRGVGSTVDGLLIPITRTNVPYRASNVTLVGVKTLSVSRMPSSTARKDSKKRCMSWRREHEVDVADASGAPGKTSISAAMASQPLQPSPFLAMSGSASNTAPMLGTAASLPVLDSRVASAINKQDSSSTTIPMLVSRQSSGMMSIDDPTMQEYRQHQYAIKKGQAFACHHAIDIADVAGKVHEERSSSKKFFGFLSSLISTTQT